MPSKGWTKEEEEALTTAIQAVGNLKWTKMIKLYGDNGTVNQSLRGRSHQSLLEKAKEMKLQIIEQGGNKAVPSYLKSVGVKKDLRKKRAAANNTSDADSHEGEIGESGPAKRVKTRHRHSARNESEGNIKEEPIDVSSDEGRAQSRDLPENRSGAHETHFAHPPLPQPPPADVTKSDKLEAKIRVMELRLEELRLQKEEASAKWAEARYRRDLEEFKLKHRA